MILTSGERKLDKVLAVFGISVHCVCPIRIRDFPLGTLIGVFDKIVLPRRQWSVNPVRELGAGICLSLPALLASMFWGGPDYSVQRAMQ